MAKGSRIPGDLGIPPHLLGLYKAVGSENGIPVRIGMDWDRDGEIADNGFDDGFHVEIDGD